MENNLEQNKIEIKIATEEDWEDYKKIRLEALIKDPQAFGGVFESESKKTEEEWRNGCNNLDRFMVFARDNNIPVGMAGAKRIEIGNDKSPWLVVSVYTNEQYRGQGISTKLMHEVITEIKNRGGEEAKLGVRLDQTEAINLYKKLGFEITETLKDKPGADGKIYDSYMMERKISNKNTAK